VFFLRSGIAHVRKHEAMTGYAGSAGFTFPGIAGWPAGVWLLAGAASIALGIWADVGSLMIALFLVLASLYFHRSGRSTTTGNARRRRATSTGTSRCSARRSRCGGSSWRPVRRFGSRSPVRSSERHRFGGRRLDLLDDALLGPGARAPGGTGRGLGHRNPSLPPGLEIPAAVSLRQYVRERRGVGQREIARLLGPAMDHDGNEHGQHRGSEGEPDERARQGDRQLDESQSDDEGDHDRHHPAMGGTRTMGSQMSGVTSPGRGSQARNAAVAGESLRDLELHELLVRSQEDVV
jgi:DoxX